LIPFLVNVAFITLLERKVLSFSQVRIGPFKVGIWGVLQPFADAIKLLAKTSERNFNSNKLIYYFSPFFILVILLILVIVVSVKNIGNKFSLRIIIFIVILRIRIYPLMLRGWSSNRKYAVIGSIRSVAQTISFEISLALILIGVIIFYISLSLQIIVVKSYSFIILSPIIRLLLFLILLIESNRTPFDFAEGERELVSGFNIEYASVLFVIIFLSEYGRILIFSSFLQIITFGFLLFSPIGSVLSIFYSYIW